ncbi:VWA domain-containing protein [Shimia sp. NS0008-38b]|uniref:VWA domain-containing protein n=1 Tax=Shimia sp. NS0008-38b TaxID=3127653 RepID=UPI003102ADFB
MNAAALAYLDAFHFLRPWVWLVALPVATIWWGLRGRTRAKAAQLGWIAPHLVAALTVSGTTKARVQPIDIISFTLILIIGGAAGPAWTRAPAPFAAQTAPLVLLMQVTPSMEGTDVAPSRLARAKQKALDLLALRAGARTALVAYAGSAHVVVPMSEDPGVMQPYLEGLTADVMPVEGRDVAKGLAVADMLMQREASAGGVVFLLDALSAADVAALEATWSAVNPETERALASLSFLYLLPDGTPLPKGPQGSVTQQVTADGRDVAAVERSLASAYQRARLADETQPWEDRGSWFVWPALLLMLFWFRRGMAVRWAAQVVFLAWLVQPGAAHAEGWRDWFLTPDQQGWLAFERKDYDLAAGRFADPYLRGLALYRGGAYETAATEMAGLDTAEAAFLQGMAHLKSRGYRDGVRAFERALEIDPDHVGAQQNLPIARQIVTYVETTQEQSDTGEDTGIGADDVVFDNESGKGEDTQVQASQDEVAQHLSTDQWMRTVDTRTADFLRQRFRLEAAQEARQ